MITTDLGTTLTVAELLEELRKLNNLDPNLPVFIREKDREYMFPVDRAAFVTGRFDGGHVEIKKVGPVFDT